MELFFEGGWTPVDKPASVSPFSAAEQRMNRAIQLGPIIFALIGASAGLCAGMLGSTAPYRVHFENSLPLLFLGGFVGTLLGCGVTATCTNNNRLIRPVGLPSIVILCAALAASMGWIAGTDVASRRLPYAEVVSDVEHLPPIGMALGAGIGCLAGLAMGGMQRLLDRRRTGRAVVAPD